VDAPSGATPILRVCRLSKTFGATRALRGLDLDIEVGEIHALIGHNGSGKSTFVKTLAGYQRPDPGGQIWVDGEELSSVDDHRQHDLLRFVHQDLGLVRQLSATDNIALHGSFLRRRTGTVDWRAQEALARELLATFDVHLDVRRPLGEATPVERTVVAIAGALQGWESDRGLLVLDEPSSVLPPSEVAKLLQIVRQLRARGISVLYVSHRLEEILAIGDRVTVLRDGQLVSTHAVSGLTKADLISLMLGTGTDVGGERRREDERPADGPVKFGLEGRAISNRFLHGVDIAIGTGEVVGLAGLPGSGREDLPYALAGALPDATGELRVPGPAPTWSALRYARRRNIAFVPSDRGSEGVVREMSIGENLSLSVLNKMSTFGLLSRAKERAVVHGWMNRLTVTDTPSSARIDTLSGGNQQKVLIGRSLARRPCALILSEPTAGVDVGARAAIYDLIKQNAAEGVAVLVSSSDITDLLAVCHRVVVLRDGRAVRELTGQHLTEHAVVRAMEGVDETRFATEGGS
jgi:ribose transport system ATP-binding protein